MNSIGRKMSPDLDSEGPGLVGGAAGGGTQSKLSFGFVVQCLLSRFSLVYDIQFQKEKDSTYL